MKKKTLFIAAGIFLGVCTNFFGQNQTVKAVVGDKFYTQLKREGTIVQTSMDGLGNLGLMPKTAYESTIKNNLIPKQKKDFYFTYEGLYYIPKTITVQKASELARSISKLEGLSYYSNTQKKNTVLYKKAYCVSNAESKSPIADNTIGNADGKTLYCLLDDNSFGENTYKLTYKQSETELLTSFVTVDDMGIGPIRAIMPGNLTINLLVIPCDDGIVVYICADLDSKNLPGVKAKITESISARMEAISKWFISLI